MHHVEAKEAKKEALTKSNVETEVRLFTQTVERGAKVEALEEKAEAVLKETTILKEELLKRVKANTKKVLVKFQEMPKIEIFTGLWSRDAIIGIFEKVFKNIKSDQRQFPPREVSLPNKLPTLRQMKKPEI